MYIAYPLPHSLEYYKSSMEVYKELRYKFQTLLKFYKMKKTLKNKRNENKFLENSKLYY